MRECYHATRTAHQMGKHIVGQMRALTGLQAEVEQMMEDARPGTCCSRMTGLFVADDPAHAEKFLMAEPYEGNAPIRIFKVSVPEGDAHPLVLVDRLAQLKNDLRATEIATEYWQPKYPWDFTERVVHSMHVLEEIPRVDLVEVTVAGMTHAGDRERAVALWP